MQRYEFFLRWPKKRAALSGRLLNMGMHCLFSDNFDVDLSLNLFVEIDGGGEGTDFLQFGTVDHDFLTVDFVVVLLFQSLGNLLGSDGAEEVAILTHFGSKVDSLLVDGSLHGESLIAEFLFLTSALADVLGQTLRLLGVAMIAMPWGRR